MLHGTFQIPKMIEESACRISLNYRIEDHTNYKVHSTSLIPNIPFGEAENYVKNIDNSIFINDNDTMLSIGSSINTQNYINAKYTGEIPYESYDPIYNPYTDMGTQFTLICKDSDPTNKNRTFE